MNIEHLILARSSSVDSDSNAMSIFDMIEDLTVQAPAGTVNIPAQVIVVFKRTDESGPIRTVFALTIEGPDKKEILRQKVPVNFEPAHVRNRLRINTPLPIDAAGVYRVTIQNVEESTLSRYIEINISRVPPMAARS